MPLQFNSVQQHTSVVNGEGRTQIMEVKIKNGRGHKKVTFKNTKGKTLSTDSQDLSASEIEDIMSKKFIPGLFETCLTNCKNSLMAGGGSGGGGGSRRVRRTTRRTRRRKN